MPMITVMYDSETIKYHTRTILSRELLVIVANAFSCKPEDVSISFYKFGEHDWHRNCHLDIVIDAIETPFRRANIKAINELIFDRICLALQKETKISEPILISIFAKLSPGAFIDGKITKA